MSRNTLFENNGITTGRKVTLPAAAPRAPRQKEWVELINLTPEMAAQWKRDFQFDGQRDVSKAHVAFLAAEMRMGRFARSEFRLVHVGNKTYQTNGGHRVEAVIQSGVTIPATVYHQVGKKREDVAKDYTHADINLVRTQTARLKATDIMARANMVPKNFNALCTSLGPIIGGFTSTSFGTTTQVLKSIDVRIRAINDHLDVGHQYFDILAGTELKLGQALRRKPVCSVALVTLKECPASAIAFWSAIAEDDGLRKGDPCYTLLRWLYGKDASNGSYAYQSRIVAAAWNSFVAGKQNHQLKVYDEFKPLYLAGTVHYNGKSIYLPYGDEA